MNSRSCKRWVALAVLLAASGVASAQAAGLEEVFRDYLNRLRAAGQTLREAPQSATREITTKPVLERRVDQLPLGHQQYAVFVAPGCRSCAAAVKRLRDRGLKPEVLDLSTSATAREAFSLVGGRGVPTLLVGSHRVSGYSDKAFNQAIVESSNDRDQAMRGQGS